MGHYPILPLEAYLRVLDLFWRWHQSQKPDIHPILFQFLEQETRLDSSSRESKERKNLEIVMSSVISGKNSD